MADDGQAALRDIHLLTTDVLLSDLVGGRAIALTGGKLLKLESDDARAVLGWYRRNGSKWAANLNAGDAEAIVDTIGMLLPPDAASVSTGASIDKRPILRLTKVVAHRFAGLHAYGRSTEPPATFTFVVTKSITLFEGTNGSGKTSIANAIVWCLTGHLIRSQRAPEEGPTEFACEATRDGGTISTHPMSAITPMQHTGSDLPADGKPIPADSWVELSFVDADGNELPPLRREQSRRTSGKIVETPPDLDTTGVDPIAWRIVAVMPALLPFLAVGSTSQLGVAVARLTGLADLVDLAKHAGKASARIVGQIIKERKAELDATDERYTQAVSDLTAAIEQYPTMAFDGGPPTISGNTTDGRLVAIADHFSTIKADALAGARDVLGVAFDPESKLARDDLEASVRPAIELLKLTDQLPSIARLSALSLDREAIAATAGLLAQLASEAAILAELASHPERSRRTQL